MGDSYLKRTGTIDLDAAAVTLRCVVGDTFRTTVDVTVERPSPYVVGETLSYPLPASDWVWDSAIYERETHDPIASFLIEDHPEIPCRLILTLTHDVTRLFKPGVYEYWVQSSNVDEGTLKTWLRGAFEVTRKPD